MTFEWLARHSLRRKLATRSAVEVAVDGLGAPNLSLADCDQKHTQTDNKALGCMQSATPRMNAASLTQTCEWQ